MADNKKRSHSGFTLIELIVVVAIIGILAAVLAPQYIQYVEKARESKVIQEASAVNSAAQVALTAQIARGGEANATWKIGGEQKYGRISNYWLTKKRNDKNFIYIDGQESKGVRPDSQLGLDFIDSLGLKNAKDGVSSVPISSNVPGGANGWNGSMDENAEFQVIYDNEYNIYSAEYSRNGYLVKIKGGTVTVTNLTESEGYFTKMTQ